MNVRVRRQAAGLLLAFVAGVAVYTAGAPWWRAEAVAPPAATSEAAAWYCPMHPDVVADHAGNCPRCGMALVRNAVGQMVRHGEQFHVEPRVQQRMGLAVEPAQLLNFRPSFVVPAELLVDERLAVSISPKVEGWIRRLGVSVVGQPVRQGQMLFEIYSPELQQRQKDYIDLLGRSDALQVRGRPMAAVGNKTPDLLLGSIARERYRLRARLAAADVPQGILQELERTRRVRDVVPVLAERDGIVTRIGARAGAYVMPTQTVLGYTGLSATWAELSLTPEQLALLTGPGRDEVELRSPIDPRQVVRLRPDVNAAVIDPATRLARLRVQLRGNNPGFPPGALLDAWVHGASRRALVIRKDAVIRTGQGDYVVVADDHNHFRQVVVQLGAETGDEVEVLSGLVEQQRVVTNGQFLLSAEASLQAARQRLRQWRQDAAGASSGRNAAAMTMAPAGGNPPDRHAHD